MSLIPTWPIAVAALVVGLFTGYAAEHKIKTGEIAQLKLDHEVIMKASVAALSTANDRAQAQEDIQALKFASLSTDYEAKRQNEKALDTSTITALRNDVVRLRVATNNRPASGGQLPGTATCACTGDGQAEQTLAPAVAARLAGRYADYNEIVDQLGFCQEVLLSERKNLATQP